MPVDGDKILAKYAGVLKGKGPDGQHVASEETKSDALSTSDNSSSTGGGDDANGFGAQRELVIGGSLSSSVTTITVRRSGKHQGGRGTPTILPTIRVRKEDFHVSTEKLHRSQSESTKLPTSGLECCLQYVNGLIRWVEFEFYYFDIRLTANKYNALNSLRC